MECCIGIFALVCIIAAMSSFFKGFARTFRSPRSSSHNQRNTETIRNIALLNAMNEDE